MKLRAIYRFLRDIHVRLHYYHFKSKTEKLKNVIIMFIDDRSLKRHPGLVDRFKAIIGMYYIAKINERNFKLSFSMPFKLEKYLIPNEIDWRLAENEVDYGIHTTKLIVYDAFEDMPCLNEKINQYHCYFYTGHNYLQYKCDNWEETWRNLFNELF